MKKMILCLSVYLMTASPYEYSSATEVVPAAVSVNQYVKNVYESVDFGKNPLSYDVFEKAYHGYLNLRTAGKLSTEKDILTICDFSKSSADYRLWIIDLRARKVLINDYVAHGQGSGDEFATAFSNRENSHQSSLGFYVTGSTYIGGHGESLRLHGMDNGYNDKAYDRAIVIHGAQYVSKDFVAGQQRLGRSWGCPAVSNNIAGKVINTIKDGTCLFIYSPDKKYLTSAYWLNKKIDGTQFRNDNMMLASATPKVPVYVYDAAFQQKMQGAYQTMKLPLVL